MNVPFPIPSAILITLALIPVIISVLLLARKITRLEDTVITLLKNVEEIDKSMTNKADHQQLIRLVTAHVAIFPTEKLQIAGLQTSIALALQSQGDDFQCLLAVRLHPHLKKAIATRDWYRGIPIADDPGVSRLNDIAAGRLSPSDLVPI